MIPFTSTQSVLEVGGGENPKFRPNLDVRELSTVDVAADLSEKWPVPDANYDGVYSSYVIEHVSWRKLKGFVGELFRVTKPGGTVYVITANTEAQMRWALEQGDDYDRVAQCLFGDLDYPENSHKAAFSPGFAIRLFREAGFEDVAVLPHGELRTDMVIEARKPLLAAGVDASKFTSEERKLAYNRFYFDGGRGKYGGYSREGYWDYPAHWTTFRKIREHKPESVLELGCARGYLLKRLQDDGIRAEGLEVSEHCYLTRVCDGIRVWDLTQTPWPFRDKEFDLCVSTAVLEHIPEAKIGVVTAEIRRISRRGLHGIDFGDHDDGFDKTHCFFRDQVTWDGLLNGGSPSGGPQIAVDKESLEHGPTSPPGPDGLVKLNCGSFRAMFHHGWLNLDQHPLEEFARVNGFLYHRADLNQGIPAADNTVDLVYASHFLEHLSLIDGERFLQECWRTMKVGAVLRLILPDTMTLCTAYTRGELGKYDEISDGCAGTAQQSQKLWELLFSNHLAVYDMRSICSLLKRVGFASVVPQVFRSSTSAVMRTQTLDMFPELSLFVEAIK